MQSKSNSYGGRGWPPARRKEQAERMRRTKPWLKATGPKTKTAKARISQNAYKHGRSSAPYLQQISVLRYLLRAQHYQMARLLKPSSKATNMYNLCVSGHVTP